MTSSSRIRRFGLAASAVAFGLVLVASPLASASAASITATPATGLSDGDSITATVAGFGAGEKVVVAECAAPGGTQVCDWAGNRELTTDAAGNGSVGTTARATFLGFNPDGSVYGTVDCKTVEGGCVLGAVNQSWTTTAFTPISFG